MLCDAIVMEITLISTLGEYNDCHSVLINLYCNRFGQIGFISQLSCIISTRIAFRKDKSVNAVIRLKQQTILTPSRINSNSIDNCFKIQYRIIYYSIAHSVSGHDPHCFLIPYSTRYFITHIHTLYYFFIIRFLYSKTQGKVFH